MPKRAILFFTKALADGDVKSRLKPALTDEQRCELHLAFLDDLAASISDAAALVDDVQVVLCSTTPSMPRELSRAFGSLACRYLQQRGNGFKERLVNAFSDVFASGFDACVVLGSDCVEASGHDIACALHALDTADAVFGPSGDGGFYIAGTTAAGASLFDVEGYGTSKALSQLEERAACLQMSFEALEQRDDVDTLFDLQRLYHTQAQLRGTYRPRATLEVLERVAAQGAPVDEKPLSVIVPVLNEAAVLDQLCHQLEELERKAEVIIVDGSSTDGTPQKLGERFRVLRSVKGRGTQLNAGAAAARGEVLLFLHADSVLEKGAVEQMRAVLEHKRAGCFEVSFPRSTLAMRCCEALSNFRAKHRHVMFGDQGIFMERSLYDELGGFEDIELMEDYQLSLELQRRDIPYGVADARILTSDRRFCGGMLHQLAVMRQMAKLRKRYRDGEDPAILAAEYREIR